MRCMHRARQRALLCACLVTWGAAATLGCRRTGSYNGQSLRSECFRVTPAGPMRGRDSVKVAKLFRLVRMDSTHVRWNAEVDSATRELRYLYLDPEAESLGYIANFWAKDARSDSLHWWGGNGFSSVELVLTPQGHSLVGYETVGGDAPGGHPRRVGLVRADPVACGPLLLHRSPPDPDSGWSTAEDTPFDTTLAH